MRSSTLFALAVSLGASSATVLQGFNYGATKSDGTTFQMQADFESLFSTAKKVSSGFTSARLYTMIQGGSSTNEPTQAIPAAISQDTSLLLGIWASGGEGGVQAEIDALQSAIKQYGDKFAKLVVGISVGSEDLYRISPTGIAAKSGAGANPSDIVNYIGQVRSAIANTGLSGVPIGHVDTWTAWANASNSEVAQAVDWVGVDAYPYFQNSMANSIEDGPGLFNDAMEQTKSAVGAKPLWITETGWPISGATENLAVPSVQNAKAYWDAVGCANFGKVNTFWFTLQDAAPVTPNPSFGIVGSNLNDAPYFDLSCEGVTPPPATTAPTGGATTPGSSATGGATTPGSSATKGATSPGSSATGSAGSGSTVSGTNTSIIPSPSSNSPSYSSPTNSSPNSPEYSTTSPTGSGLPAGPPASQSTGPSSGQTSGSATFPQPSSSGVPGSPANTTAIGSASGGKGSTSQTSSSASPSASANGSPALAVLSGPLLGAVVAGIAMVATL